MVTYADGTAMAKAVERMSTAIPLDASQMA
jgi:hypothetical protein